jgi:hypothetical protein
VLNKGVPRNMECPFFGLQEFFSNIEKANYNSAHTHGTFIVPLSNFRGIRKSKKERKQEDE